LIVYSNSFYHYKQTFKRNNTFVIALLWHNIKFENENKFVFGIFSLQSQKQKAIENLLANGIQPVTICNWLSTKRLPL
jgi:hypothetical protein